MDLTLAFIQASTGRYVVTTPSRTLIKEVFFKISFSFEKFNHFFFVFSSYRQVKCILVNRFGQQF